MKTIKFTLTEKGAQSLKAKKVDCYYTGMAGVGSLKERAYQAASLPVSYFLTGEVVIDMEAWAGREKEAVAVALGMRKKFARHIETVELS